MNIKLTNSLTRKKEGFSPLNPPHISLYVCGITPYDLSHIGHGRCYVSFDLLARVLKFLNYQVTYVRNYTDIEDKILKKAAQEKQPYTTITERYINLYRQDMIALNCINPDHEPRVTEYIQPIIAFIQKLIEKKHAYVIDHDVYFNIASFPLYGKLSGKKLDELEAGARVDVDARKKNTGDFALWKGNNENLFWESPWGYGRPGWHIECSVMANELLGPTIDIHAGGADLTFPHHENEIAQSESLHEKTFARFWLHNAFVTLNKEKMSKSLGNTITLKNIFEKYDPMVLRYFFLQHHYRTPIDFSFDELEGVQTAYKKLITHFGAYAQSKTFSSNCHPELAMPAVATQGVGWDSGSHPLIAELIEALCDDLNSPKFLGLTFQHLDKIIADASLTQTVSFLLQQVLGFTLQPLPEKTIEITPEIEALIKEREQARTARDWKRADALRDQLMQMGYVIRDKKT